MKAAATQVGVSTSASGPRRRGRVAALGWVPWASVLAGLAIWEIIGRYVGNSLFLATPLQTIDALISMSARGELLYDSWVSAKEFGLGYIIAVVLGIAIGLTMATSRVSALILDPWVSALYATPIIAIAPLVILWFGIGIWSKVFVVASVVIFPVIINTEAGIRGVDRNLIEAVKSFGATRTQIFLKVSLPAALPFILTGLRLGIGRGLIGVVVGELFGARAGLGFVILRSAEAFRMPDLFAAVSLFAIAGIVLTAACQRLEKVLLPWRGH